MTNLEQIMVKENIRVLSHESPYENIETLTSKYKRLSELEKLGYNRFDMSVDISSWEYNEDDFTIWIDIRTNKRLSESSNVIIVSPANNPKMIIMHKDIRARSTDGHYVFCMRGAGYKKYVGEKLIVSMGFVPNISIFRFIDRPSHAAFKSFVTTCKPTKWKSASSQYKKING